MTFTAPTPAAALAPRPLPGTRQSLADLIDAALPQTQCTRCGYPDCRAYANALAAGAAAINRCPPGGQAGIVRLAALTGQPVLPLDTARGREAPRLLAVIDEAWCIGCALCIQACPVDCIIGAPKRMHTVIDDLCSGCELCVPACPVDCIALLPVTGARTGWQAWTAAQADQARARYATHQQRALRRQFEQDGRLAARAAGKTADLPADALLADALPADLPADALLADPAAAPQADAAAAALASPPAGAAAPIDKKRAVIDAAVARARARQAAAGAP